MVVAASGYPESWTAGEVLQRRWYHGTETVMSGEVAERGAAAVQREAVFAGSVYN